MTTRDRAAIIYGRQSRAIYLLQMKHAIMEMTLAGLPDTQIARHLGQSVSTIKRYRDQARDAAFETSCAPEYTYDLRGDLPPDPAKISPRGSGPGPHVRGSIKRPRGLHTPRSLQESRPIPPRRPIREVLMEQQAESPPPTRDPDEIIDPVPRSLVKLGHRVVDPADVEDPTDIRVLRNACLDKRKAMMTFREIAESLGITEPQARAHTAFALRELQDSVTSSADLERRLMVEQIDDMIRGIRPQTVSGPQGEDPILDAIDRMLKLLDRKAKLLGLDQPEGVDIMIRLQNMAEESKYDMVELQDIARDVLAKHRIRIPGALMHPSRIQDDAESEAS